MQHGRHGVGAMTCTFAIDVVELIPVVAEALVNYAEKVHIVTFFSAKYSFIVWSDIIGRLSCRAKSYEMHAKVRRVEGFLFITFAWRVDCLYTWRHLRAKFKWSNHFSDFAARF